MTFDLGITDPARRFGGSLDDAVARAAAVGVDGIEFFDWEGTDLNAVNAAADEHGIEIFGTLAAGAGANIDDRDAPAMGHPEHYQQVVTDVTRSIAAVEAFDGSTLVVTVGPVQPDLDAATQRDAIVTVLTEVAPVAENAGVTVVVEPLNVRVDHPGYFLTTTDQAVGIVDAVDSPNVKLLFDVYHQQITEGDIIRRFQRNVEHVGLVHIADTPGRNEPGTGELHYENILTAIAATGYDGYVSCEFDPIDDPDSVFAAVVAMANEARGRP